MGSYDLIVQSVLIAQGIEFKLQKRKSSKFSLHVFFNRLQQKGMDVSKLMKDLSHRGELCLSSSASTNWTSCF